MDKIDNKLISFIIPVYNEQNCLERNMARLIGYVQGLGRPYELIIVDDGSIDDSLKISRQLSHQNSNIRVLEREKNRGKGDAVRAGMLMAKGRYRIFLDADLAVPVNHIGSSLDCLDSGAQVVIGSRHLPGSCIKLHEKPLRRTLGSIYRCLTLWAFRLRVTDITCGFKGFDESAAREVFGRSKIPRWGYDAEILFLSQRLGYTIHEIPVDWRHSFDSAVRIVSDSFRTMTEMFQIYLNYFSGNYNLRRYTSSASHPFDGKCQKRS